MLRNAYYFIEDTFYPRDYWAWDHSVREHVLAFIVFFIGPMSLVVSIVLALIALVLHWT